MKFQWLRLLLALSLIQGVSAFQWPLQDPTLLTAFGEEDAGRFFSGIELQSDDTSVAAVETGRLVFYQDDRGRRKKLPTGGRNFLLMEHDRGIRSLLGGLQSIIPMSGKIDATTLIGKRLSDTPLFLEIQDYEYDRLVNPLLSLPKLADDTPPRIRSLMLVKDGKQLSLRDGLSLEPGNWDVYVDVVEEGRDAQTAPHRISLFLNGEEKSQLLFDTIDIENGKFFLDRSGKLSAETVYRFPDFYRCGEVRLSPGAFTLEVAVNDFAENEDSQAFLLRVR